MHRNKLLLPIALLSTLTTTAFAADLPIREVILYKHGVGYFERSGQLQPGETAQLDFKAADMNDVLKSLTITDRNGGKIGSVRYDASESLAKRLEDFPFAPGEQSSMAAFLDRMKGARLELRLGAETAAGTIVSARLIPGSDRDKSAERETVVLLTDSGDLRSIDLGAASSVKFSDPKVQGLLKDYLGVLNQARSKDRRSVYIDSTGATAARQLVASYMTPAAVWKSSYRLIFGAQGEPTLEGWAIIDNTSGDDWTGVKLSVVSGRPISFITQLYAPKYVTRPNGELTEDRAVNPVVYQGALAGSGGGVGPGVPRAAAAPQASRIFAAKDGSGVAEQVQVDASGAVVNTRNSFEMSTFGSTADGRDVGDLFEYSFATPVTVKKDESAMLPFLQQKIGARKLLIYSEGYGLHPMNAAELTNSTGKTLDGGPITVYDADSYAGEALVETVKAADKRLISYGVDLGTRISTAWKSSRDVVREIHLRRGTMTTRSAVEETKTYTIKNVDAKAKTLVIEHAQRPGYQLLSPEKPAETTATAYRFEVKLGPSAEEAVAVREERVFDQSTAVSSLTPDVLATWIQNKTLSDAGRRQLGDIAAKKRQIADNDGALRNAQNDLTSLTQDEGRIRNNISSLNNVSGQQQQVQQYAAQLAAAETKLAGLRDMQSDLQRKKTALESELNALIDKADF